MLGVIKAKIQEWLQNFPAPASVRIETFEKEGSCARIPDLSWGIELESMEERKQRQIQSTGAVYLHKPSPNIGGKEYARYKAGGESPKAAPIHTQCYQGIVIEPPLQ